MRFAVLSIALTLVVLSPAQAFMDNKRDLLTCLKRAPQSAVQARAAACSRLMQDKQFAALHPGPKSLILLGRIDSFILLGQYNRAIKDCDEAIRIAPVLPQPFAYRGIAKLKLNQHQSAIKDLSHAIRLNARLGIAYKFRAVAHERVGNRAAAISDYRTAVRLTPGDEESIAALKRLGVRP